MALRWWCPVCWAELPGPEKGCACGFSPEADHRDYVDRLVATLRHPMADRAAHAAAVLGKLGDPRAVEPLCSALSSGDPYLQGEAASALGAIGSSEAVPALGRLLADGSMPGRMAAVGALARIGDQTARSALTRAAREDPAARVRAHAERALALPARASGRSARGRG